jgi:hypothetical protein
MMEARILELRQHPMVLAMRTAVRRESPKDTNLRRLLVKLKLQFPTVSFRADVEREMCVFASSGDAKMRDLMRQFCEGFAASL